MGKWERRQERAKLEIGRQREVENKTEGKGRPQWWENTRLKDKRKRRL